MNQTPHPLESVFNIQPGTTPLSTASASVSNEMLDPSTGEIVVRKTEDVSDLEIAKEERIEDLKIDGQIDVIHGAAMTAFEAQHRLSQEVDPKFSARNAEVAAQYLKIALDAVGTRVDIVADRNDLLKNMFENSGKAIEELGK